MNMSVRSRSLPSLAVQVSVGAGFAAVMASNVAKTWLHPPQDMTQ